MSAIISPIPIIYSNGNHKTVMEENASRDNTSRAQHFRKKIRTDAAPVVGATKSTVSRPIYLPCYPIYLNLISPELLLHRVNEAIAVSL